MIQLNEFKVSEASSDPSVFTKEKFENFSKVPKHGSGIFIFIWIADLKEKMLIKQTHVLRGGLQQAATRNTCERRRRWLYCCATDTTKMFGPITRHLKILLIQRLIPFKLFNQFEKKKQFLKIKFKSHQMLLD